MVQLRRVVILGLLTASMGCGGVAGLMQMSQPVAQASPGRALVKIHRPSAMAFAINFGIWDRDRFVGISSSKTTVLYECDPGEHLFVAVSENVSIVRAQLEADRVYDLVAEAKMGAFKARVLLVPVTMSSQYRMSLPQFDMMLRPVVVDPYMSQTYVQTKQPGVMQWVAQFDQGMYRGPFAELGAMDSR